MDDRQKSLTDPGHLEIELADLGGKNYPTRQTVLSPGGARRQSATHQEPNGEDDGGCVTKNISYIQVTSGEDRYEISTASVSYILEIRPKERGTNVHSIINEEPTEAFQRDAADLQGEGGEDAHDFQATTDENYFLENYELQFKHPTERGVRRYPSKRDSTKKLINTVSNREVEQHLETRKECIGGDGEYWRRYTLHKDSDVNKEAYKESSQKQRMTEALQWYRAREMRAEERDKLDFYLVIVALGLTFISAALFVVAWEYLSSL